MDCLNNIFHKKFTMQKFYFFIISLFFYGNFNATAQCPTLTEFNQSFCDIQGPTVASLQATDNGGGIVWYATATSTTPLPMGTGLVNGEDYFLDSSAGTCGSRPMVIVSIYAAPTGLPFQGFCISTPGEATIASLSATGNNVQWYNTPFNGTPLSASTVLGSNTIYYAGQTNPITGCLTSRLAVFVVVNLVTAPIGDPIQFFCNDPLNPPTVNDLVASGTNNWYLTNSSALVLAPTTPLVDGQVYYGTTFSPPCESTERLQVLVTFVPMNDAGLNGELAFCETELVGASNINLFDSLTGTPMNTGVWTGPTSTTNGNLGTLNISNLSADQSPYVFTYTVTTSTICPPVFATVTITIDPLLEAGNDGIAAFCDSDVPTDLISFLGGAPDIGGIWTPTLASGTGVFDPLLDAAGIYTYTVSGTTSCPIDTATVTVSVQESLDPGLDGTVTFCESDTPLDLFTILGGNPDLGGTWSPTLTSGTGFFNPSIDGSGIYTYTLAGTTVCPPVSGTVTVTVDPLLNAGNDVSVSFCSSETPTDLFTLITGNPEAGGVFTPALASGSSVFDPLVDLAGVYIYTITSTTTCPSDFSLITVIIEESLDAGIDGTTTFCESDTHLDLFTKLGGTPDLGGTWSPALNSGTGVFNPSIDAAGIYTYTLAGTTVCSPVSATVTVIVNPLLNAGNDTAVSFCSSETPTDLFSLITGSPDAGGIFTPALASGTSIFDPLVDVAGVYTYTLTSITTCPSDFSLITVTIEQSLDPGLDGTAVFCENDTPLNLFLSLGGTPTLGGTWSPALNSGTGFFDPSIDLAGIYTYTLAGTTICPAVSATVAVTINPLLEAGTNGTALFCSSASPSDLFTYLGGNPDAGGIWTPTLASGTGVFNPAVDAAGVYIYTVSGTTSCPIDTATVTVTIEQTLNPGLNGNAIFCANDAPVDLFTKLGGTPNLGGTWSPALNSGTGIFDPSIDVAGIYTYTLAATTTCPAVSATVTVTINPLLQAGIDGAAVFCSSASSSDLFTFLGGNPNTGGTWTPTLTSGTGIFNPLTDAAGIYTYTVSGISPCSSDTAIVTVTIEQSLNPGINGNATFCGNDVPVDLFTKLGGTPNTGGTWSPALNSGTGVFNPSIDVAGIYTYTLAGTTSCPAVSATVTVVVNSIPTNTLADFSIGTICLNSDETIIVTNAINLSNGNYQLTYSISGAITYTNTITVVFVDGGTSFIIPSTILNTIGNSILTINAIESNTGNNCGKSSHFFNPKSFTIEQIATPTFNGIKEFCDIDNATIGNLNSGIVEPQTIIWYDAAINGNPYTDSDLLMDGNSYYAALVSSLGCESTTRLAIEVKIKNCDITTLIIPDGFSPNGDGINDAFVIKNIRTLYPNFAIEIYNRWGNILFRGNASKPDWNGTTDKGVRIGGSEVPVGVYFFIINFNDGIRKELQGRLYLSR
jgi:gliding motility-associated-like protein